MGIEEVWHKTKAFYFIIPRTWALAREIKENNFVFLLKQPWTPLNVPT